MPSTVLGTRDTCVNVPWFEHPPVPWDDPLGPGWPDLWSLKMTVMAVRWPRALMFTRVEFCYPSFNLRIGLLETCDLYWRFGEEKPRMKKPEIRRQVLSIHSLARLLPCSLYWCLLIIASPAHSPCWMGTDCVTVPCLLPPILTILDWLQ